VAETLVERDREILSLFVDGIRRIYQNSKFKLLTFQLFPCFIILLFYLDSYLEFFDYYVVTSYSKNCCIQQMVGTQNICLLT
jgi:hypothetical protein